MTYSDIKILFYRPLVSKVIALSIALLIVWQMVSGLASYMSLAHLVTTSSHPSRSTPSELHRHELNAGLSALFFGDYVPKNLNEEGVKRSMLNLKVVGIMLSSHEEDSHVILQTASGHDQTFRVGDVVPGGAVIKRITVEGVLVDRNGELESLTLPKNDLLFDAPPKPLRSRS